LTRSWCAGPAPLEDQVEEAITFIIRRNILNVVFQKLGVRLAALREVVSGVLKEWQGRGVLEQSRGEVSALDREVLRRITHFVT